MPQVERGFIKNCTPAIRAWRHGRNFRQSMLGFVPRNAHESRNPFGRIVAVPSLWPRPGGVLQQHGLGVYRALENESSANFCIAPRSVGISARLLGAGFPEADFGTKLGPGSSHSQTASNWAAGQERSPSQIDCALFLQSIGWVLFFDESSPELAASFLPSVLSCASCTSLHTSWG